MVKHKVKVMIGIVAGLFLFEITGFADKRKKFHCEKEENGKIVDLVKVKSRKQCKKMGGKWVKEHDHGEHDH